MSEAQPEGLVEDELSRGSDALTSEPAEPNSSEPDSVAGASPAAEPVEPAEQVGANDVDEPDAPSSNAPVGVAEHAEHAEQDPPQAEPAPEPVEPAEPDGDMENIHAAQGASNDDEREQDPPVQEAASSVPLVPSPSIEPAPAGESFIAQMANFAVDEATAAPAPNENEGQELRDTNSLDQQHEFEADQSMSDVSAEQPAQEHQSEESNQSMESTTDSEQQAVNDLTAAASTSEMQQDEITSQVDAAESNATLAETSMGDNQSSESAVLMKADFQTNAPINESYVESDQKTVSGETMVDASADASAGMTNMDSSELDTSGLMTAEALVKTEDAVSQVMKEEHSIIDTASNDNEGIQQAPDTTDVTESDMTDSAMKPEAVNVGEVDSSHAMTAGPITEQDPAAAKEEDPSLRQEQLIPTATVYDQNGNLLVIHATTGAVIGIAASASTPIPPDSTVIQQGDMVVIVPNTPEALLAATGGVSVVDPAFATVVDTSAAQAAAASAVAASTSGSGTSHSEESQDPQQQQQGEASSDASDMPPIPTQAPPNAVAAAAAVGGPGCTRCPCNDNENEDGFMLQCELCEVWQHGLCIGINTEAEAPPQYFCELCVPDLPVHVKRRATAPNGSFYTRPPKVRRQRGGGGKRGQRGKGGKSSASANAEEGEGEDNTHDEGPRRASHDGTEKDGEKESSAGHEESHSSSTNATSTTTASKDASTAPSSMDRDLLSIEDSLLTREERSLKRYMESFLKIEERQKRAMQAQQRMAASSSASGASAKGSDGSFSSKDRDGASSFGGDSTGEPEDPRLARIRQRERQKLLEEHQARIAQAQLLDDQPPRPPTPPPLGDAVSPHPTEWVMRTLKPRGEMYLGKKSYLLRATLPAPGPFDPIAVEPHFLASGNWTKRLALLHECDANRPVPIRVGLTSPKADAAHDSSSMR